MSLRTSEDRDLSAALFSARVHIYFIAMIVEVCAIIFNDSL